MYGLRLADVVFDRPPSEVLALVEVLPPTSRFYAHIQGKQKWREFWGWDKDRHMFADWIDLYISAKTAKGKTPQKYQRPGRRTEPTMRDIVRAATRNQRRG